MRYALLFVILASCEPQYVEVAYAESEPHYDPGVAAANAEANFYDALAPYGTWVDTPYGQVWQPDPSQVGYNFVPYATDGQWVSTDYGWAWNSDFGWGWAPFHYGRWFRDPRLGWCWLPGAVWGPAWVDWRAGDNLIGWCPTPPVNVPIAIARRPDLWMFTDDRGFLSHDVRRHAFFANERPGSFERALPVRNHVRFHGETFNAGPRRERVEAETGQPVRSIHVAPPVPGRVVPPPNAHVARPQTPPAQVQHVTPPAQVQHVTPPAQVQHVTPPAPPAQAKQPAPPAQAKQPAPPAQAKQPAPPPAPPPPPQARPAPPPPPAPPPHPSAPPPSAPPPHMTAPPPPSHAAPPAGGGHPGGPHAGSGTESTESPAPATPGP